MSMMASIMSLYLLGLGKTPMEVSYIVSASGLFPLILGPLSAYIMDRTGQHRIVTIVLLVATAVSSLLFLTGNGTFYLFMIYGTTTATLNCASGICDKMATAGRYRYGSVRFWGSVGYAIAAQVAGFVYDYVSPSAIFLIYAAASVLTVIGFNAAYEPERMAPKIEEHHERPKGILRGLLTNKYYLFFLLPSFFFCGIVMSNHTFMPVLLKELGMSTTLIGTVTLVGTVVELPFILLSNRFMDKFSVRKILIICAVAAIVQYVINAYMGLPYILVAALLIKSPVSMIFFMLCLRVVFTVTDQRISMTALSVVGMIRAIGIVAFQNVAGYLLETSSLRQFYAVCLGVAVVTLVFALIVKWPKSDTLYFT